MLCVCLFVIILYCTIFCLFDRRCCAVLLVACVFFVFVVFLFFIGCAVCDRGWRYARSNIATLVYTRYSISNFLLISSLLFIIVIIIICLFVCLFVCLLGNLFSIPEKSSNFLRWLQSLAAYSRNTRKRDSYHPWPVFPYIRE